MEVGGFELLRSSAVQSYLRDYGFAVADADTWLRAPVEDTTAPFLVVKLDGHEEVKGHTLYRLDCSLAVRGGVHLDWKSKLRLIHLREGLHDRVKVLLGDRRYSSLFGNAHFPPKGGFLGTTSRLNGWFDALATCINGGLAPPSIAALTLQMLGAPEAVDMFRREEVLSGGTSLQCEKTVEVPTIVSSVPLRFSDLANVASRVGPKDVL